MLRHVYWQLFRSVHLLGWTRCWGKLQTWKASRHWVALQGPVHRKGSGLQTVAVFVGWGLPKTMTMPGNPCWSFAERWHSQRLKKMRASKGNWPIITFFSYSHTNRNFFCLFCNFKPEAAPCWQRKENRMALSHLKADDGGATLHFDATLVSFALCLFNHFCLLHLKLWTPWIREKTSIWDSSIANLFHPP